MGFLINEHQNFSGNAADLANLASQCARYLGLSGDLEKINERTVRYYVSEGLVERPERIGRDAQYGYIHLLQFLAGRFLVESGFPMQKVGPYLMTQSIHELEMLITNRNKPNMAELLVASFQRGGEGKERGRNRTERIFTREVDINKRDLRTRDRSDEDRSDVSSSMASSFSRIKSLPRVSSVEMRNQSDQFDLLKSQLRGRPEEIARPLQDQFDRICYEIDKSRDGMGPLHSQIHDLALSMKEQFNRIHDEMDRERARSRDEHEKERMEWRKEREALQQKIDQLLAIVAQQNKGKEHE